MEISSALKIAISGLKVQTHRMDVIAQNLANASSMASTKGGEPYRRQEPTVYAQFDRELGAEIARSGRNVTDKSPLRYEYQPNHPLSDEDGYIKLPNVNPLVEVADMREAQRAYEANLNIVRTTQQMIRQAIGVLRE